MKNNIKGIDIDNLKGTKGAQLIWSVNPVVTGIEFTMPPVGKIRAIYREYFRLKINDILNYYSTYRDNIVNIWQDKDIKFTIWNGNPAYTASTNNSIKKNRRQIHMVNDDNIFLAWRFNDMLVSMLDELRLLSKIIEISIWGLKSHIYTKPKITRSTLKEYQQLYNEIEELKNSIKQWRNSRLVNPTLPKWLLNTSIDIGE